MRNQLSQGLPILMVGRGGVLGRAGLAVPPRWILAIDMLVLATLPLLSCIDIATDGKLSRIYYSVFLIGLLLIKLIVLPGLSISYARATRSALAYLFSARNRLWVALFLYLLLIMVAHMRGIYSGTMQLWSFIGFLLWSLSTFLFVYLAVVMHAPAGRVKALIGAYFSGMAVYLVVNFAAYAAGMHGTFKLEDGLGANRLMSFVGIQMSRLSFPISSGPTAFGPIAGMLATIGLVLLFFGTGGWRRLLGLSAVFLGLAGLFLVDSRSALVSVPLALLISTFFIRVPSSRKYLLLVSMLLPLVPLLMVGLIKLIEYSDLAALLQRQSGFAQRLGVASGRENIWLGVMHILAQLDPLHIVGYGAYGQVISGASKEYSWVFSQFGASIATAHNASLQVILDMGYIGCAVWVFLIYQIQKAYADGLKFNDLPEATLLFGSASVYFVISGFFDVSTTFYQTDTYPLFLAIVGLLVAHGYLNSAVSASVSRGHLPLETKCFGV